MIGALPVTAVIVRSSANINAGAKSKNSAIIHAVLLFLSVLLIPQVLILIPNASLASILIMTGYKLTKLSLFKDLFQKGLDQFLPFVITIIVMLTTDLLKGVGAGIVIAVIFIIRSNIKQSFDIAEQTIDGRTNYIIKLPQHITFFNKGYLLNYFKNIKSDSLVIIDGAINKTTDKDALEIIQDFKTTCINRKIELQIINYKSI